MLDETSQQPGVGLSFRKYGDGYNELVVFNNNNDRNFHKRKAGSRAEQSQASLDSALSRCRQKIREKNLVMQADNFFTLTSQEKITEPDVIWHYFKMWLQRLKRAGYTFPYVAVLELQKRGALHIHLSTNKYLPIKVINKHWEGLLGQNTNNAVDVSAKKKFKLTTPEKIAYYMTKYMTKEMISEFGRKRYRASQKLVAERSCYYTAYGLSEYYYRKIFNELTDEEALSTRELKYNCFLLCSWQI